MFASLMGSAERLIPMPTMADESRSPSQREGGVMMRLYPMTNRGQEVFNRLSNMVGPLRVCILDFQPGDKRLELFTSRSQRDAVFKIQTAITECEQFGAQEIEPPRACHGLREGQTPRRPGPNLPGSPVGDVA
jgi:hypothetical protein